MSSYAYHYHAETLDQRDPAHTCSHGVIVASEKLDCSEKYVVLTRDIAAHMGYEPGQIVITSLTFLHEVP